MKVAVCISGALRGNLRVLTSINEKLVCPNNADVFLTTWDNHYLWNPLLNVGKFTVERYLGKNISNMIPKEYHTYDGFKKAFPFTIKKMEQEVIEKTDIQSIKNLIPNIKKIKLFNEKKFINFIKKEFEPYLAKYESLKRLNQFKMFSLMYECDELLSDYETNTGTKYDYVIRIRPDLFIQGTVDNKQLICDNNSIICRYIPLGISDSIFIADRQTMKYICSIWTKMIDVKALSPYKNYPEASDHFLLLLWLISGGVKIIHSNSVPCFDISFDSFLFDFTTVFPAYKEMIFDINNFSHPNLFDNLKQYLMSLKNSTLDIN